MEYHVRHSDLLMNDVQTHKLQSIDDPRSHQSRSDNICGSVLVDCVFTMKMCRQLGCFHCNLLGSLRDVAVMRVKYIFYELKMTFQIPVSRRSECQVPLSQLCIHVSMSR
jgi:hypothetical protein